MSLYEITKDSDGYVLMDGKRTVVDEKSIDRYYEYCYNCIVNREVPVVDKVCDIFGEPIDLEEYNRYYIYDTEIRDFDEWLVDCTERSEEGE